MTVSIIVPVYNVAKYLAECIQGVLDQTFQSWELILVNDGSKDCSGAICDDYAAKDDRIRVIHKSNTGVSDTRNVGLSNARGKYVMFLDADDYWYDHGALEILVSTAQKYQADIVRGEYKAVNQDGALLFERPITESKIQLTDKLLSSGVFYTKILDGENFLVLSLIERTAIGDLRLNAQRAFLEDMEFYAHLLLQPLRCVYVPVRFYAYRKIASSASHTPKVKNLADGFSMCDVFDKCYSSATDDELRKAYKYNRVMKYYLTLKNLTLPIYYPDRNRIIEDLELSALQKKVSNWAKEDRFSYPCYVYMSPGQGVRILRFIENLKCRIVSIRSRLKRLLFQ